MSLSPPPKKRRTNLSPPPDQTVDDEDNYQPYVPVQKRRQERLNLLASRRGPETQQERAKRIKQEREEQEDEEQEEERKREKARQERTLLLEAQDVHSRKAAEGLSFTLLQDYASILT